MKIAFLILIALVIPAFFLLIFWASRSSKSARHSDQGLEPNSSHEPDHKV